MNEAPSNLVMESCLAVAREAAVEAAKVSMKYFDELFDVEFKSDESPVTIADRETETVLRKLLNSSYPEYGIFGEEHGCENIDADFVWVIDPIDGTKSFISGIPLFGMLISLTYKTNPILSLIHMPALNETYEAVLGKKAINQKGQILEVRKCNALSEAICFVGEADKMFAYSKGLYEKLAEATKLTRFNYDCYPYTQLAKGKIDMVIECNLKPYDFCALVPVVEGAGGTITDWSGNRLTIDSPGDVLACGDASLHKKALALIAQWREE